VAHAYNPSYSGRRDQEDHGFEANLGKHEALSSNPNTTQKKKDLVFKTLGFFFPLLALFCVCGKSVSIHFTGMRDYC
jgi:hypothetical protein